MARFAPSFVVGTPLLSATLLGTALLAGCGGSGGTGGSDADRTRLAFDFDGGTRSEFTARGRSAVPAEGAVLTFSQGSSLLTLNLPSANSGTYAFGSGSGLARGTYGLGGVAGNETWSTGTAETTSGIIVVARKGEEFRVTLRGVRFLPDAGTTGSAFTLSGFGIADPIGPPVP